MNDAFLLPLRGPLQSYADKGFGQIREAGLFPSRSSVLGIVAAAFGIARHDSRLVRLHDALCVHVATVRPGSVMTDFHTVDAGGANKTLTYRDYFHDACFVALIEARTADDAGLLDEARQMLRHPKYVPYLGRRACVPSVPLLPVEQAGSNPIEVLSKAATAIRTKHGWRDADTYVYLDGHLSNAEVREMMPSAEPRGHGERRDRLVQPRRTFTGRPFTGVLLPATQNDPTDPQRAYFDAAS